MGDISVLKNNIPSVGLSLRGRSTLAETLAATLYILYHVFVKHSVNFWFILFIYFFLFLDLNYSSYLVRPSCIST